MTQQWTGDVNDAVVDEWKAETSPFERVRDVLLATTEFQYAGAIADRARVSEPSARKHLRTLSESRFAATDTTGQGTRYKRSTESVAMQRMGDIHSELSRPELIDGIRDLKSQVQSYRERYDVTDPDDLAVELDPDDDGWADIAHWRTAAENLDLAKAALALYDFDPDGGETGSNDGGAFAENTGFSA